MGKMRKRQMGETAITEQFPQHMKDLVTLKKLLLLAAQMTDSFYLVCPLTDETIEKIRAAAYEWREKTFPKERRITRIPTDDPLLSTQYGRRFHYEPLTKREMQTCLTKYYGWKEWSENPWGSYARFRKWTTSVPDNEMAVWAVNETSMGRAYLVRDILERLGQLDYSKMTEEDLLAQIGYGAAAFLHVKHYTGWEDFLSKYPTAPLPVALVNRLVSKVYPFDFKLPYSEMTFPLPKKTDGSLDIPRRVPEKPFEEIEDFLSLFIDARNYGPLNRYIFLVSGIYLWYIALDGVREKAKGHPELESFLSYTAATDTQIAELCRRLAPKDYAFPDKSAAWEKLDMALEKGKRTLEWKYRDILDSGDASTGESLLTGVNYWKSKAAEAAIAGLKGQLGNSLLSIVKRDFIDALRKEDSLFARLWKKAQTWYEPKTKKGKIKLRERVQDLCDKIQCREPLAPSDSELLNSLTDSPQEEAELIHAAKPLSLDMQIESEDGDDYCLGDTIEDKQAQSAENIDEPIDLERLGFNIDELTPKEIALLNDLNDMVNKGYSRDSKQGLSPREYWGKDYERKMKMLQRLNAKRRKC